MSERDEALASLLPPALRPILAANQTLDLPEAAKARRLWLMEKLAMAHGFNDRRTMRAAMDEVRAFNEEQPVAFRINFDAVLDAAKAMQQP